MKKFLIIFGSIVAVIAIAISVFLITFDVNRYRSDIVVRLSALLGRPVQVEQMTMKMAAVPTVKIGKIRILNNGQESEPFVDIDNAEITLALAPLLSKRLEIRNISLAHVTLNLMNSDGKADWKIGNRNSVISAANQIWLANTQIESLSAKKVDVIYHGEVKTIVPMLDLSVKHLKVFTTQLVYNGNVFQVSGTVNDLLDLARHVPDYAFNLEVTSAEMTVKINGAVGDTSAFKKILINATASGKNLRTILEKLGLTGSLYPIQSFQVSTTLQGDPDLMEIKQLHFDLDTKKLNADLTGTITNGDTGLKVECVGAASLNDWGMAQMWGLRPLSAQINITATPSDIVFNELMIQAGRSDARVTGAVAWAKKPQINVSIESDYLNLQDVILGDTTYNPVPNYAQDIQTTLNRPIDWSWMNRFDGTVKVLLPHLQLTENVMMGVYGTVALQNKVLSMTGIQINFLNGMMTANMMADANTQKIDAKVKGKTLALNAVRGLEYVIKDGIMDGEAEISAVGNSLGEMLAHLTGTVKAELYRGRIVHSDFSNLADLLFNENKHSINYTTADRESDVLCGAVNLVFQDGQMRPVDSRVALETSRLNLKIDGGLNFKKNEMNVMMTPSSPKVNDTAVPKIKVMGSFFNPTVELADGTEPVDQSQYKPYLTCESILGHKTKLQLEELEKSQRMLPLPQVRQEKNPAEDTLQDQLMKKLRRRK